MKIKEIKWHFLIIGVIAFQLFPMMYMLSISVKETSEIFSNPIGIIPKSFTFENYKYIINNVPIIRYTWNTFFIAFSVTVCKLFTSILAAYVLTFKEFKGKKLVTGLLFMTIFIPFTVTMIPNYIMISNFGLLNKGIGVILPQMADGIGIFLMIQNMRGIPKSILEAAKLDKIPESKLLFKIVMPMIKNSVVALGILFFINSWNEYFWPLLVLGSRDSYSLSLALQMFISAEGGNDWGITMAISALTILCPIIMYLFAQKQIMNSFIKSGVKG